MRLAPDLESGRGTLGICFGPGRGWDESSRIHDLRDGWNTAGYGLDAGPVIGRPPRLRSLSCSGTIYIVRRQHWRRKWLQVP
jgi:hypothetical protein